MKMYIHSANKVKKLLKFHTYNEHIQPKYLTYLSFQSVSYKTLFQKLELNSMFSYNDISEINKEKGDN